MKGLLVAVVLLLPACAEAMVQPDVVSSRGSRTFANGQHVEGLTLAAVDEQETQLVDGLVANGWDRAQVDGVLHTVAYVWEGENALGSPAGDLDLNSLTAYLEVRPCLWASALRHEAAHALEWRIHGDPDDAHADPTVWTFAGVQGARFQPVVYARMGCQEVTK